MISTAMGEVKCASALETDTEFLVSNDSSCLLHLQGLLSRKKEKLKTIHLAEILLRKAYGNNYPSLITFITGPSRTGDIERILVLGAHGPRILTVVLLPDEKGDTSL